MNSLFLEKCFILDIKDCKFSEDDIAIEINFLDYITEDLNGKIVKLNFNKYLDDTMKFCSLKRTLTLV